MGPRSLMGWGPGPKWPWTRIGLGAIWAQDGFLGNRETKRALIGPKMDPFGLKLGPNEAESIPGPYGSPPGPFWTHFGTKNQNILQNPQIPKISEIWNLAGACS